MTADSLSNFKTERDSIRGQLYRFKQFLDNFRADKKSMAILSYRLLTTKNLLQSYHRIQTKIEVIEKCADPKDRASFEDLFYDLLARAQLITALIKKDKPKAIPFDLQEYTNFVSCILCPESDHEYGFEMTNPCDRFPEFQNTPKACMPYKKSTPGFYKLNQLESCMESQSIQNLQSIAARENYNPLLMFMKKHVNDRSLIHCHIKAIHQLPPMENGSYLSMKKFYSSIKEHIDALQTLGQDLDVWNILLINIVEQKLDVATREDWKRVNVDQNTSLDTFIKYLANRCRYFELKLAENQENISVCYEEYNEKSNLLSSTIKYKISNQTKTDYGSKEKELEKEKISDSENDTKKKKDKNKTKKAVQGGVVKVFMCGLHSFITSITKKMFKVLAKAVFKFFVKAYLKWQVVTPMSIQLV